MLAICYKLLWLGLGWSLFNFSKVLARQKESTQGPLLHSEANQNPQDLATMAASSYFRLPSDQDDYWSNNHNNPYPRPEEAQLPPKPYSGYSDDSSYNGPSKPVQTAQSPQLLKFSDPSTSHDRQRKLHKLKRYLRISKIATKVITVTFSTIMTGFMLFMTITYQTTKNEIRNERTAWPRNPKLWPTFMLLAGAGLTLLLSAATLFSYCLCFNKSKRSWKLTIVKYIIHILAWVVISTLYRYEKSLHGVNNDLWGWTCCEEAAAIQAEFHGVVNFGPLCTLQVSYP